MTIEVLAAILAGSAGLFTFGLLGRRDARRRAQEERDEKAQLIAMGDALGIEYVPGEDTFNYRLKVVIERDRRAERAR
jgi:hypothetical protein